MNFDIDSVNFILNESNISLFDHFFNKDERFKSELDLSQQDKSYNYDLNKYLVQYSKTNEGHPYSTSKILDGIEPEIKSNQQPEVKTEKVNFIQEFKKNEFLPDQTVDNDMVRSKSSKRIKFRNSDVIKINKLNKLSNKSTNLLGLMEQNMTSDQLKLSKFIKKSTSEGLKKENFLSTKTLETEKIKFLVNSISLTDNHDQNEEVKLISQFHHRTLTKIKNKAFLEMGYKLSESINSYELNKLKKTTNSNKFITNLPKDENTTKIRNSLNLTETEKKGILKTKRFVTNKVNDIGLSKFIEKIKGAKNISTIDSQQKIDKIEIFPSNDLQHTDQKIETITKEDQDIKTINNDLTLNNQKDPKNCESIVIIEKLKSNEVCYGDNLDLVDRLTEKTGILKQNNINTENQLNIKTNSYKNNHENNNFNNENCLISNQTSSLKESINRVFTKISDFISSPITTNYLTILQNFCSNFKKKNEQNIITNPPIINNTEQGLLESEQLNSGIELKNSKFGDFEISKADLYSEKNKTPEKLKNSTQITLNYNVNNENIAYIPVRARNTILKKSHIYNSESKFGLKNSNSHPERLVEPYKFVNLHKFNTKLDYSISKTDNINFTISEFLAKNPRVYNNQIQINGKNLYMRETQYRMNDTFTNRFVSGFEELTEKKSEYFEYKIERIVQKPQIRLELKGRNERANLISNVNSLGNQTEYQLKRKSSTIQTNEIANNLRFPQLNTITKTKNKINVEIVDKNLENPNKKFVEHLEPDITDRNSVTNDEFPNFLENINKDNIFSSNEKLLRNTDFEDDEINHFHQRLKRDEEKLILDNSNEFLHVPSKNQAQATEILNSYQKKAIYPNNFNDKRIKSYVSIKKPNIPIKVNGADTLNKINQNNKKRYQEKIYLKEPNFTIETSSSYINSNHTPRSQNVPFDPKALVKKEFLGIKNNNQNIHKDMPDINKKINPSNIKPKK